MFAILATRAAQVALKFLSIKVIDLHFLRCRYAHQLESISNGDSQSVEQIQTCKCECFIIRNHAMPAVITMKSRNQIEKEM